MATRLTFGVQFGTFVRRPPEDFAQQVALAEQVGFSHVWMGEAYGSDALTPLAWAGSVTRRIGLGTAVMQIPARTPTAAAMAALTLDQLSGGRALIGFGVSGPQVVEGWYGQSFRRPLVRTREYFNVVRQVLRRRAPVTHEGAFYQLPLPGGTGLAKPLKSSLHPYREEQPLLLGAQGPNNVALAAEIADGWLPFFFSPSQDAAYRQLLEEGFSRRSDDLSKPEDFQVVCPVPIALAGTAEEAADAVRPTLVLYIGGMGPRGKNFHFETFARMGFEAEADTVQRAYLAGDKSGAAAAIPLEMVEEVALVGPPGKIRADLARWESTLVTSLVVNPHRGDLREIADVLMSH